MTERTDVIPAEAGIQGFRANRSSCDAGFDGQGSMPYAALWCKSNFSFLEGASHPDELVEQAHVLGVEALALTDRDGVHGAVRAHVKARELGVSLIVGAEVTIGTEDTTADATTTDTAAPGIPAGTPPPTSTCVLLATDRTGYANLCRLITAGRLRRPKGESCVTWSEVCARAEGLIALLGGDRSVLVRDEDPRAIIEPMREAFGDRLYVMVSRHRRAEEVRQEARVRRHAERAASPWSPPPRCCTTYPHAVISRMSSPASAAASPSPPPAASPGRTPSTT